MARRPGAGPGWFGWWLVGGEEFFFFFFLGQKCFDREGRGEKKEVSFLFRDSIPLFSLSRIAAELGKNLATAGERERERKERERERRREKREQERRGRGKRERPRVKKNCCPSKSPRERESAPPRPLSSAPRCFKKKKTPAPFPRSFNIRDLRLHRAFSVEPTTPLRHSKQLEVAMR